MSRRDPDTCSRCRTQWSHAWRRTERGSLVCGHCDGIPEPSISNGDRPARQIPPCYGSSGVTIVAPGASWPVDFAGDDEQPRLPADVGAVRDLEIPDPPPLAPLRAAAPEDFELTAPAAAAAQIPLFEGGTRRRTR